MKSLTRSSTADQVDRIEMGVSRVVSITSRMLSPSTPMWKLMVQLANWIQGRSISIWMPGSPILK